MSPSIRWDPCRPRKGDHEIARIRSPGCRTEQIVRLAYFDCFSGLSGDMVLGALVDAGADLEAISRTLSRLPIDDFAVEVERVEMRGLAATRIHVHTGPQEVIRTYVSIRAMLEEADIPGEARRVAQRVYRLMASAASRIHAKDMELVTFHEFGELDCLVDVVGSALALDMLEIERVFSSPIPTGLGMARTEHGMMPIPSPIVVNLLQGAPTYSRGIPVELVTPVGAAILSALAEGYGDMPVMRTERAGYGAGHLRLDFPNVLRIVIGQEHRAGQVAPPPGPAAGAPGDVLIEVILDDIETERCQRLMEGLIGAGARDAWAGTVMGRGGQPRMTLSAVGPAARAGEVVDVLRAEPDVGEIRLTPVSIEPGPP